MIGTETRKLLLRLLTLGMLTTCLIYVVNQNRALSASVGNQNQEPEVLIQLDDSTLVHLEGAFVKQELSPDGKYAVEVNSTIRNLSGKSIVAYAITQTNIGERFRSTSTVLSQIMTAKGALPPFHVMGYRSADSVAEPLKKIILSVDFIEFTDGTKWGTDQANSAETLTGRREGLRALKLKLSRLRKEKGVASLIEALDGYDLIPPAERSSAWKSGFRDAVGYKINKLRSTYRLGVEQGDAELEKSHDIF